ncbi:MAG: hypothetical protein A3D96_05335 [Chlamydiae bacterium RIFCSPHIGHO2_12_FULL_44_59]|nr:MAG: hypothetical protein A2796_03005 [Chlamydiae bacterium RIFCSPHIGHO2_01_FULL_44_39]OGN57689.1 MAG: hypothetical protein A3C42_06730 [Chlamydiae bacterium RIFCSPHIGHO2_02_FULL_45_9]OGN60237.1 MAG: hypothetical protein A3D96_05335 [Chlamydiae bacterium RIFCSPHIGHO2_12_FULL_44_59]OGN67110.1 MAG: hypothetical protein A2978_00710 [Chlamydiae bacterium RIFCSPLOWO2_01_FULL_44_52]OGN71403.1 MAG: hypothetical protein A3F79_03310 [Chlamydiae bacterium RIFCSPLOWO2_12_FULL_45_20]
MALIGIDIGGTKILACIGDKTGKIFASKRIATKPLKGPQKGLPAIAELIRKMLQEVNMGPKDIQAIGISSPGPVSVKKGMMLTPPNLPEWHNTKLVEFFEKEFEKPTVMNNDANAAALAEYDFGGSQRTPNLVYLTCSTGMGGGAIVEGKLVQGISDVAAEVGHFVLDIQGPQCPCGQRGCFEEYCGGAALARKMQKEIQEKSINTKILELAQGNIGKIDAACLVNAVKENDPYARTIWSEFTLRLAQGIGVVLMNFNPEALILGTIAIHAGDYLLNPVKEHLINFAWKPNVLSCRVEASAIGEEISELSGIALAIQALEAQP